MRGERNLGTERLRNLKMVDIGEILEPLLGFPDFEKIYFGTLRNLDFTAGCSLQCPICYVNASPLSAAFEPDSLIMWIKKKKVQCLFAKRMRVGLFSDPGDHPRLYDLTEALLSGIEERLDYDTSLPVGSEGEFEKILQKMEVEPSLKPEDLKTSENVEEYLKELRGLSLPGNFSKLAIWFAYKDINAERIAELFGYKGEDLKEWGIGFGNHYVPWKYKNVGIHDYRHLQMVKMGRFKEDGNYRLISPDNSGCFDSRTFPHTPQTISKGKFVITPKGPFMVVNVPFDQNPTGKSLIEINRDNYRELGMKYLIEDPNPVYIEDYKPNPFYSRNPVVPVPRRAVLGYLY